MQFLSLGNNNRNRGALWSSMNRKNKDGWKKETSKNVAMEYKNQLLYLFTMSRTKFQIMSDCLNSFK